MRVRVPRGLGNSLGVTQPLGLLQQLTQLPLWVVRPLQCMVRRLHSGVSLLLAMGSPALACAGGRYRAQA